MGWKELEAEVKVELERLICEEEREERRLGEEEVRNPTRRRMFGRREVPSSWQ